MRRILRFNTGYCCDGQKEKIVFKDANETKNVGKEQNVDIKITDASEIYLITKSDRTFNMGSIEDFKDATGYALLNEILTDTNAVEKNIRQTENLITIKLSHRIRKDNPHCLTPLIFISAATKTNRSQTKI